MKLKDNLGLWMGALFLVSAAAQSSNSPDTIQPVDRFFNSLKTLCGQKFEGVIVADEPPPAANDPFTGKRLLMHVRDCDDTELRIPFMVGDDRSRTWLVTRTSQGLRLKHDHRHADGTPDEVTLYGGDTRDLGTASRQSFPADEYTLALFERQGLKPSLTNVWSLEIIENQFFVYELARPEGRLFRVQFDLRQPK